MEFKAKFPKHLGDLAKEIAAFATSNDGLILIGVADDGSLQGLADVGTPQQRDLVVSRVEGICRNSISPAVTPTLSWLDESGSTVLAVRVTKGAQPVYYADGRPYLRHITAASVATPSQVYDLVAAHVRAGGTRERTADEKKSSLFSSFARPLHRVLLWAATPQYPRDINPMLDEWQHDFCRSAADLRELALTDEASEFDVATILRETADSIDAAGTLRVYLGSGEDLQLAIDHAADAARRLKAKTVDHLSMDEESLATVRAVLRRRSRELCDLGERAGDMAFRRPDDLKSALAAIVRELGHLSFYQLEPLGDDHSSRLRAIVMRLRLSSFNAGRTLDGGRSLQQLADDTVAAADELAELALDPE